MLNVLILIGVLASAVIDWVAVARNWKKTEYIFKPVTMLLLFCYLALACGFGTTALVYFGLGILFSLAGDVFLMVSYARFSDRWFLPGLASFLLAHVSYILGLNTPLLNTSPLWAIGIGILLAIAAARILRRILAGVQAKGLRRMVFPVALYGMVITLMLLSAILTIYRPDWKTSASGLVCLGAILFYASDLVLAWNKFVKPVKNGRVVNMALYHLGQIALIVGAVLQFSN
jgi:uncharacterized membrane protein YhhN